MGAWCNLEPEAQVLVRSSRTVEAVRFVALVVVFVGLLLIAGEYLRPQAQSALRPLPPSTNLSSTARTGGDSVPFGDPQTATQPPRPTPPIDPDEINRRLAEIAGLETDLAAAENRIAALEVELREARGSLAEAVQDRDQLQLTLADLSEQRDRLAAGQDELRDQIEALQEQVEALRAAEAEPELQPGTESTPAPAPEAATPQQQEPAALGDEGPLAGRGTGGVAGTGRPALSPGPGAEPEGAEPETPGAVDAGEEVEPPEEFTIRAGINAYEARDFERAAEIWGTLAETGAPLAQFHYGALLFEGRLGQPQPVEAFVLVSQAAAAGVNRASALRDAIGESLTPGQLDEALDRLQGTSAE